MSEEMNNINRDMKTKKKNQMKIQDLKNKISEIKTHWKQRDQ